MTSVVDAEADSDQDALSSFADRLGHFHKGIESAA